MTKQVLTATFARLLLNTARRFPYTFAPVLGRGLGVPLTAVSGMIAVNQLTGVLGIFFGPVADRLGYRPMMLASMALLVVGMAAGGAVPHYGAVLAALFAAGLAKSVFDPAIQAYVGARVPYHRRGRVVGMLEVCWAGSTLVGIPLAGLLIDRFGWRSPFLALSAAGLLALVLLARALERAGPETLPPAGRRRADLLDAARTVFAAWRRLSGEPAAMAVLAFAFLASAGTDNLVVVYGAWLEKAFELNVVSLGMGTGVIGAAELAGEILTAGFADRLGLLRSVRLGLFFNVVCCLLLPVLGRSLYPALFGLFLVFLTFEFTIVCAISLCTEVVPGARATMMSAFLAAAGLGRVAGALVGGPIWLAGGIRATACVSAGICALGLVALFRARASGRGPR